MVIPMCLGSQGTDYIKASAVSLSQSTLVRSPVLSGGLSGALK